MGRDSTGRWRPLGLLLVGALLAGCATVRPQVALDADFRLRGKIAVRGAGDAFSASFDWVQSGDAFDIELWGPLGQGRVRLQGDGSALTVTNSRGEKAGGLSTESFMASTLGWSVPISALPHWVRGRYDPASAPGPASRSTDGRLNRFEQFGWAVEVSGWGPSALGPVPAKVVATQLGRRIVVACKEWSVG